MRTTIDIDEDVLAAAKERARAEGKTMGQMISELARQALTTPSNPGFSEAQAAYQVSSWPTLPNRQGLIVTTELIDRILDEIDVEDQIIERDDIEFDDTGKAR